MSGRRVLLAVIRSTSPEIDRLKIVSMPRAVWMVFLLALAFHASAQTAVRGGALTPPLPLFPLDNWWNTDVSSAPVDPNSAAFISFIGPTRGMHPDFGGDSGDSSAPIRSEEHTSELQSRLHLACRLLLENTRPQPIPLRWATRLPSVTREDTPRCTA